MWLIEAFFFFIYKCWFLSPLLAKYVSFQVFNHKTRMTCSRGVGLSHLSPNSCLLSHPFPLSDDPEQLNLLTGISASIILPLVRRQAVFPLRQESFALQWSRLSDFTQSIVTLESNQHQKELMEPVKPNMELELKLFFFYLFSYL